LKVFWAIVCGALLALAYAWWTGTLPGRHPPRASASAASAEKNKAAPALYRWRNDQGVLQLSNHPPKGRPFERVRIRDDQNVIRANAPAPEPPN